MKTPLFAVWNGFISCWKKENYANFNGRAKRTEFWGFVLFDSLVIIPLYFVDKTVGTTAILDSNSGLLSFIYFIVSFFDLGLLSFIYFAVSFTPRLAVYVRRLHDIGKSGWYVLLSFLPIIGIIIILIYLCKGSVREEVKKYKINPYVFLLIILGVIATVVVNVFLEIFVFNERFNATEEYETVGQYAEPAAPVQLDTAQRSKFEIISKDYYKEESGGRLLIHLENIGNSDKIYNLINKLVYDGKNFEEYIESEEKPFFKVFHDEDFPEYDGLTAYYDVKMVYSIIGNNDTHIIFEYYNYFFGRGAAHPNYETNYLIIDLIEERILDINDLINPISDDLLKKIIKSQNDCADTVDIWPPDAIDFCKENTVLLWNKYRLGPGVCGEIKIEIQDKIANKFLTNKGKALKKTINRIPKSKQAVEIW